MDKKNDMANALNKYKIIPKFMFICFGLVSSGLAFGQFVTAEITLDTNKTLLGDQLGMVVIVEKPGDVSVRFPEFKDDLTDQVYIVRKSTVDTFFQSDGREQLSQKFVITAFDTGYVEIPALEFILQNGQDSDTIFSNAEMLEIESLPVEDQIRDIKANEKAPLTPFEILPYLLGLAVLLLAIWLVRSYFRKKYQGMPTALANQKLNPPDVVALGELEQLKKEAPWLHQQTKQYYIKLSEIIRNYLEQQFHVMALEQTTDDILQAMKELRHNRDEFKLLSGILTLSDLVKFAKAIPDNAENEKQIALAIEYVKGTSVRISAEEHPDTKEVKPETIKELNQ